MSMQFKWDKKGVAYVSDAMIDALELTAETLRDEVREAMVVPRDTGNLQNEAFGIDRSRSAEGIVALTFNTPYARRLYFHPEYKFSKKENPHAQGEWMKSWLKGGKNQNRAAEIYSKILKRSI